MPKAEVSYLGNANQLEERAVLEKKKRLGLFLPVKNKVLMANERIYSPFDLTIGEESLLGLFAVNNYPEDREGIQEGLIGMELMYVHERSALLGRVFIQDTEGRLWRDIDLKGVGYFMTSENDFYVVKPGSKSPTRISGFLSEEEALADYKMSERFLTAGIRTHRTIGIIEIKEAVIDGRKIGLNGQSSTEQLPHLSKDFKPVIQLRAFVTKARVENAADKMLYEDAKRIIRQELGANEPLSEEDFAIWFAHTLGVNIGLIHKNKWVHRFLSQHNITLDCRIVDLDGVEESEAYDLRFKDFADGRHTLQQLIEAALGGKNESILDIYKESYLSTFPRAKHLHRWSL